MLALTGPYLDRDGMREAIRTYEGHPHREALHEFHHARGRTFQGIKDRLNVLRIRQFVDYVGSALRQYSLYYLGG